MIEITNCNNVQFRNAFSEYFKEIGVTLKEDSTIWNEIDKSFIEENMKCFVEYQKDEIIGFIMFQIEENKGDKAFFKQIYGFIRELWIKPNYRHKGIGKTLVENAFDYFKQNQVYTCLLTYDEEAIGFYQKLGFKVDLSYQAKMK